MTVIAAIASAMKQARATPRMSDPARAADDDDDAAKRHDARQHGSRWRNFLAAISRPVPAARKGPVATMMATLDTSVSCSAGMKAIIANVEYDATSQPLMSVSCQIPQAGAALQQHHQRPRSGRRRTSRARTGWSRNCREAAGEERRGAPGDGGGDDEGYAEAMLGARLRHVGIMLARGPGRAACPRDVRDRQGWCRHAMRCADRYAQNQLVVAGWLAPPGATSTMSNGTPLLRIASVNGATVISGSKRNSV